LLSVAQGRVRLEDPLSSIYPEFIDVSPHDEREHRESVTLWDLLGHRAGFAAVAPLWRRLADEQADEVGRPGAASIVASYAAQLPLEYAPRTGAVYSDLGFIMLGVGLSRLVGTSLESLFHSQFAAPLGADVAYRPASRSDFVDGASHIAPCGSCSWRGGIVRGAVQDENAWAMGGDAGHAGLFGTLGGVQTLVAEYGAASRGKGRLLDRDLVLRCWRTSGQEAPGAGQDVTTTWARGWDTPTPGNSSAGRYVSSDSVGHLGFTGTSVWIDRARGVHVILLTNRLHPDRENITIRSWRPKIHDAAFSAIDAESANATVST
jgi:CubicO group peptidase (beta-lactamase class C family)